MVTDTATPPRRRTKAAAKPQQEAEAVKPDAVDENPDAANSQDGGPVDLEARIAELEEQIAATQPHRPRNVIEAVIEVMRLVKAVGKDGRNEQQNFNFRGIDGVLNAVGPALRKVGVLCVPAEHTLTSKKVEVGQRKTLMDHQTLEIIYRFHYSNADGEITTLDVPVIGESQDAGDKSISKAFSVAYRTCLIQSLSLPTTERDPDADAYENHAEVAPLDPAAVKKALDEAIELNKDDPAAAANALIELGDNYGAPALSQIELPNKNGELISADQRFRELIAYFRAVAQKAAEEAKAAQNAAEGSQDAPTPAEQAPAATPADDAAQAARAEEEARAAQGKADADATLARQQANPSPNDRKAQMIELARQEAELYAEVMKMTVEALLDPVFKHYGKTDLAEIPMVGERGMNKYLLNIRPRVIELLREQRRVEEADALTRAGDGWPLRVADLIGGARASGDSAPAAEAARG